MRRSIFTAAILVAVTFLFLLTTFAIAEQKTVVSYGHARSRGLAKSVPEPLSYQGQLINSADSSAVTTTLEMTFRLFDSETKGAELWAETHPAVEVSGGLFQVLLGSVSPFPGGLFDGSDLWLQTEAGLEVLVPRKPLVSVAYSHRTNSAEMLLDNTLTDLDDRWVNEADLDHLDAADGDPAAAVHVNDAGKVGIGTTSPLTELDVNGSVNADTYYGDGSNLTGISGTPDDDWTVAGNHVYCAQPGSVGIGTASPASKLHVAGGVSATTYFGDGSNLTGISGSTDNDWTISGNDIYSALPGNVGIGTLSPAEKLVVSGNVQASGTIQSGSSITLDGLNDRVISSTDLELHVNSGRVLRLESDATSPNLIGGHSGNSVTPGVYGATIGGGGNGSSSNSVTGNYSTVAGGQGNTASSDRAFVGGGQDNTASSSFATVGGGWLNQASLSYAAVCGGNSNTASGSAAFIGGGSGNTAGSGACIGGGSSNTANANSFVGGGSGNTVSGEGSVIGGGVDNRATDDHGTVGGGYQNLAGDDVPTTEASYATVSGGSDNWATYTCATIGGGGNNRASSYCTTIGGGGGNIANDEFATVGGGDDNTASGDRSTVAGGDENIASGDYATIPGGTLNTAAGKYSFAAGRRARANNHGSFVWADSTDADFTSNKDNEFAVRARDGMRVYGISSYYGAYIDNQTGSGDGLRAYANVSNGNNWGALYAVNYGSSPAIYATATTAGYFSGNVTVTGTMSKGGGSFKIDHPLDPENKYLYHSFVESPDMMNIYNGNAILDSQGQAWVELPEWFEALNRDFRYQLTALGAPGPNLYIAEKIMANRFKIAGGEPNMEVSWQVTGIRQDAFANANRIPVEEDKSGEERGKYLHAKAHGLPERLEIGYEARVKKENEFALRNKGN